MVFRLNRNERLLLVGEGNFSFTKDLLLRTKNELNTQEVGTFTNVYASCFEDKSQANVTDDVRKFLESQGVSILYNVDATRLEEQDVLKGLKFSTIIFNFPHIAGKMRMDLNRSLLTNFFISASSFLIKGGHIIVSLCEGQGGTPVDKPRRYDDTWKVVECAASGGLILVETSPWPSHFLMSYRSSGFRGQQKSFRTQGAIVHTFKKVDPLDVSTLPGNLLGFHPVDYDSKLEVPLAHLRLLRADPYQNPLDNNNNVFAPILLKILAALSRRLEYLGPLRLVTDVRLDDSQVACSFDGTAAYLRSSLLQVYQPVDCGPAWTSGPVFRETSDDFRSFPGSYQMLLVDCENIEDSLYQLSEECQISREGWFSTVAQKCVIDVETLSLKLFEKSIPSSKCFWTSPSPRLDLRSPPTASGLSLYPPTFSFDLSFASDGPLSDEPFVSLLQHLSAHLIESVALQSRYSPDGSCAVYHCFRITYRSYEAPLDRQHVVKYQHNVVRWACEKYLGVVVR